MYSPKTHHKFSAIDLGKTIELQSALEAELKVTRTTEKASGIVLHRITSPWSLLLRWESERRRTSWNSSDYDFQVYRHLLPP